jgi:hypothetical protein
MSETSQGPVRETKDPGQLKSKAKAQLWTATWEATNAGLTYDEIRETVDGTIGEIESDRP